MEVLRKVAFGAYDWTQATALEVLCRLVVAGRAPETTLSEIEERLGAMRYETHLYFARALLLRGKKDSRYLDILHRCQHPGFREALQEL